MIKFGITRFNTAKFSWPVGHHINGISIEYRPCLSLEKKRKPDSISDLTSTSKRMFVRDHCHENAFHLSVQLYTNQIRFHKQNLHEDSFENSGKR